MTLLRLQQRIFQSLAAACAWGAVFFCGSLGAFAEDRFIVDLEPLIVTADRRLAEADTDIGFNAGWGESELDRTALVTIDALLAKDPTFSLYRRETASFAHPTTQGANLRGMGANAAARSLVLLDGLPQNDPFGGWIPWTRYPPIGLSAVEILPSTRAAVWGNLSAGGAISLTSASPYEERQRLHLSVGNLGYHDASVLRVVRTGDGGLALNGRVMRRDGDFLIHPDDRGSIDRRADVAVESIGLRGGWEVSNQLTLEPSWSYFEEDRGNGSPLARNAARGWDVSLRGSGDLGDWFWEATGFYQRRSAENTFTAINDERTHEDPVLDQWEMPAEGVGASLIAATTVGRTSRLLIGGDSRRLEGETHEDFGFGLGRRRAAGGVQWLNGGFAKMVWGMAGHHLFDASVRFDRWQLVDGFLMEGSAGGASLEDVQYYEDRSGVEPSLALRWEWQVEPRWQVQVGASRSFRLPTINELYRPYRVGADFFDANPNLVPERFTTVEFTIAGVPSDRVQLETGVFAASIDDVVTHVLIASNPRGGTYHRRENVDSSRVWGWQNQISWELHEQVTMQMRHRWLQSEFRNSPLQPALEGLRFPQTPRHVGSIELAYRPHVRWTFFGAVHGGTAQYDDPLNQRRIDSYSQADLGFNWDFGRNWRLVGRVENVSDEIILTGIASDGERAIATGRAAWLTLQAEY